MIFAIRWTYRMISLLDAIRDYIRWRNIVIHSHEVIYDEIGQLNRGINTWRWARLEVILGLWKHMISRCHLITAFVNVTWSETQHRLECRGWSIFTKEFPDRSRFRKYKERIDIGSIAWFRHRTLRGVTDPTGITEVRSRNKNTWGLIKNRFKITGAWHQVIQETNSTWKQQLM